MEPKVADLTKCDNKVFVSVSVFEATAYVLSLDGFVFVFGRDGQLLKWMNIKVSRGF